MKKIVIDRALEDIVRQQVGVLAGNNNKIYYIETGKEALAVHKEEQADLVIMKPDFPDMTCEEFCSAIRGDEGLRRVSILMVCSDQPSDIERCQKCGANDYIEPQTQTSFLRKAARLLNISERTRYRVIVKVAQRENKHINHVFCTSQNISSSGILLETDSVLNKDNTITCSFFLPNSIRIVIEGEIVRVVEKEDGSINYGVKFVDLPSSVEAQIESFTENWLQRKKRFR